MAKKQSALEQILERLSKATKAIGQSGNMFAPVVFGAKVAEDSGAVEAIRKAFIKPVGDELKKNKAIGAYLNEVEYNKQYPFFNDNGNTPAEWVGKVVADGIKRGPFEAAQDLTNPVIMNPYIEPIAEPIISNVRVANYKAGRPNELVNNILGQTDAQTVDGSKNKKKTPNTLFGESVENIGKDLAEFLKLGSGEETTGNPNSPDSLLPNNLQNILANPNETYYNNILEPAKNVINFSPLFYSEDVFKQEGEF